MERRKERGNRGDMMQGETKRNRTQEEERRHMRMMKADEKKK